MIIKIFFLSIVFILTYMTYMVKGSLTAFNKFTLPFLLAVPFSYFFKPFLGVPDITFYAVSSMVLFLAVAKKEYVIFQWNFIDALVILTAFALGTANTLNTDLKFGIATWLDQLLYTILPYFLIRTIFNREDIPRTLYYFLIICTILACIAPLEFLFNFKYSIFLQAFWPDWGMPESFLRSGQFRVYSGFGHPIHAGMIFSIAVFISFHLFKTGHLGKLKAALFFSINLFAVYMTMSRTSYILLVPTLLLINFAYVKKKGVYGAIGIVVGGLGLIIAMQMLDSYAASGKQANAEEGAQSLAYRTILLDSYLKTIMAKPLVGYGFQIPVMNYQQSIDNNYLLLLLSYGIPGMAIFTLTILSSIAYGLFSYFKMQKEKDRNLIWLFINLVIYYSLALSGVWLSSQTRVILFMFLGYISVIATLRKRPPEPAFTFKNN